jgi:hypothetical protein
VIHFFYYAKLYKSMYVFFFFYFSNIIINLSYILNLWIIDFWKITNNIT